MSCRSFGLVIVLTLALTSTVSAGTVYDLESDWATTNPNGVWSFRGGDGDGALMPNTASNYFGAKLAGWYDYPDTFPFVGQAWGTAAGNDWQIGDIVAHSGSTRDLMIWWTSPENGYVEIAGGLWQARAGLSSSWELRLGGVLLAEGAFAEETSTSYPRSAPMTFADSLSAGAGLSGLQVGQGDVLELRIMGAEQGGSFVGMDLSVELGDSPALVPLPPAVFMGLGLLGACVLRRRVSRSRTSSDR